MRTQSHDKGMNPRAPVVSAPHTLFILPELEPARRGDLTLLILADGNRRSTSGGGYSGGARRIVSIAEHLARRPDVGTVVACILSPDNIAKRGNGFFLELYKEFIQLGVEIATRGALVASGVHLEVRGDLGSLRARGGHAALLADSIEAVAGLTDGVADPALRLILGVGYGRDLVRELDVDMILRTGMEAPGVLRLSGLRTGAHITNVATVTLWPEIEPREVDEVITLCARRTWPRFSAGHGISAIIELILALAKADMDSPVSATITTSASTAAVTAALERLYAGPLRGSARIAVEDASDEGDGPTRHGAREPTPHLLRIVRGGPSGWPRAEGELLSVLAPGQRSPSFILPDWLPIEHANVHACDTAARDLVTGIRAAQRFSSAHPPLLGRDRPAGRVAPAPRRPLARALERDEIGDRFAAKMLAWAASAGLMLPGNAWQIASLNYALTAFFIHFRIPTEWDPAAASWEERAELTAKYMLLVAAGDEGIFDRILEGETPSRRWTRLEASARFLRSALPGDGPAARLPSLAGGELLSAIAAQWRRLDDQYRSTCLPAAAASFRAGLSALYEGSLAEHRAGIGSSAATDELRVLVYLAEVSGAIGAGLLFRTAAFAAPAPFVTDHRMAILDAAAATLDCHVRLSNDMSGFLESPDGDRDPKENACTILVPVAASGVARATAIVEALATCKRLAACLSGDVQGHVERVATAWPSMGVIFQRGVFVGRRVYEVGHYTTVSRAEMSAIFAEADEALGPGARGKLSS
jgi:hypothetical protein